MDSPPSQFGGLLSVALSRSSQTVGVTHHRALRSPDFPLRAPSGSLAATVWSTPAASSIIGVTGAIGYVG